MSENTDVNQSESGSGTAPHRSRRAIREAERAAEREAALTGQQPLLTRREMRRLREEAEALQQALEAGEITPEQARALQDPLAEQPVISVPVHGVAATPADGAPAEQTPTPATAESPAEPEETAEAAETEEAPDSEVGAPETTEAESEAATAVAAPAEPEAASAAQAESLDQAAPPSAPTPAQAPAEEPAAEEAPAEEAPAEADADTSTDVTPVTGVPTAGSPQVAVGTLTDAQMEEIADLPTGVLDAVDAPIADTQPDAAVSTPTRRSLRHRHVADEADQTAGEQTAEPAAEEEEPKVPTRRPIVRIPAAAQGVRTVDAGTGQLSAVQPVIQPDAALQVSQDAADEIDIEDVEVFGGIDNPQWRSLSDADAAGFGSADQAEDQADAESAPIAAPEAEAERAQGDAAQALAEAESAQEAPQAEGESRAGRTLLIVLLAVVIALVVLAVVWFLLHNGVIGSLPQTPDAWTRLLI